MDSRLLTTASNSEARVSWPGCCIWCTRSETGPCNCCSSITVLTFWQNLLSCRTRLALCLQLLIALLYGYIAATYSFMLMFTALSIQQQGGEKKMKKSSRRFCFIIIITVHSTWGRGTSLLYLQGLLKANSWIQKAFSCAVLFLYSAAAGEFLKRHSWFKSNSYSIDT